MNNAVSGFNAAEMRDNGYVLRPVYSRYALYFIAKSLPRSPNEISLLSTSIFLFRFVSNRTRSSRRALRRKKERKNEKNEKEKSREGNRIKSRDAKFAVKT